MWKVTGEMICNLPTDHIKQLLRKQLLSFMTPETFDIVFNVLNEWKNKDINSIKTKTADDIGDMIYEIPMNNLLKRINDEKDIIDGAKFIKYYEEQNKWIKTVTGWSEENIYQIESILFQHQTKSASEITDKINSVFTTRFDASLSTIVVNRIVPKFDLEDLCWRMKNGENITEFSDEIINMVDELKQKNDINIRKSWTTGTKLKMQTGKWVKCEIIKTYDNSKGQWLTVKYGYNITKEIERYSELIRPNEDNFIREFYDTLAECFIINYEKSSISTRKFHKYCHWVCNNCSNHNFNSYVNSKMNYKLTFCTLCGITQKQSIIIALKNADSYMRVNDINGEQNDKQDKKDNEADVLIKEAQQSGTFDLSCPNRNDNHQCPAILRLAKQLIYYKKWIKLYYKKADTSNIIHDTINVDIEIFVTDEAYQQIFIDTVKAMERMTKNDQKLLIQMINDNKDNIGNIGTFLSLKRKLFTKLIQKHTKIKTSFGVKLYKKVVNTLKEKAQTAEYGEYLGNTDSQIDIDYHHILKTHINDGNKISIEHVFRFFAHVVHFDDKPTEIAECRSVKRREQQTNALKLKNKSSKKEESNENNLWSLNQRYWQNMMDMIHTYLVHSNFEYFVKRHLYQKEYKDKDDTEMNASDLSVINNQLQKEKYTTVSSQSDMTNYGFGVDHSHPHLLPLYQSAKEELLYNKLHQLSHVQFDNLLINAIKKHKIALGGDYEGEFICKYFDKKYNIIRNEPIGIRHILAIIVYTDMTQYCTAFRETYRRINDETKEQEVRKRHLQLYYYARCLFEAVEFYGNEMGKRMRVHHGLNRVMCFEQFTAWFNQPISTTLSKKVAHHFADGRGIILTLKAGIEYFDDAAKIPKYISVSWLSCFPEEDEKLFYGANVVFRIYDIMEAKNNKSHLKELLMLNKFHKTIKNHPISWNEKDGETSDMIDRLAILIQDQQNRSKNKQDHEEKKEQKQQEQISTTATKHISEYGHDLFNFFCNNPNTSSVAILNYKSLPSRLKYALFSTKNNDDGISLISLSTLFTYLKEIILNALDIDDFTAESELYITAVKKYIKSNLEYNTMATHVEKIMFQSEPQQDRKPNSTMRKLANKYTNIFNNYKWSIQYKIDHNLIHNLIFINDNVFSTPSNDEAKQIYEKKEEKDQQQWDTIPKYFMQITEVTEKHLHVELTAREMTSKDRTLRIKQFSADRQSVNKRVVIAKNSNTTNAILDIDTNDELYDLVMYDIQNTDQPLRNSNRIKFTILTNKTYYPPINQNYQPNSIDLSTVSKAKHESNNQINIYWSIPTQSYGSISYKIIKKKKENKKKKKKIKNNKENEDLKEEIIQLLPYTIPLKSIPMSFKVVTITKVEGNKYESDPSETIKIKST